MGERDHSRQQASGAHARRYAAQALGYCGPCTVEVVIKLRVECGVMRTSHRTVCAPLLVSLVSRELCVLALATHAMPQHSHEPQPDAAEAEAPEHRVVYVFF